MLDARCPATGVGGATHFQSGEFEHAGEEGLYLFMLPVSKGGQRTRMLVLAASSLTGQAAIFEPESEFEVS